MTVIVRQSTEVQPPSFLLPGFCEMADRVPSRIIVERNGFRMPRCKWPYLRYAGNP